MHALVTDVPDEESLRPLDATSHEIRVGSLTVGASKFTREVRRRHEGDARQAGTSRERVLAIDTVTRPTKVHEVGDLLRSHALDAIGRLAARPDFLPSSHSGPQDVDSQGRPSGVEVAGARRDVHGVLAKGLQRHNLEDALVG